MSNISEKIIISGTVNDRRIKLTMEDKISIVNIRNTTNLSYLKLANMFGVSKRTIIFICKPETLIACIEKRKERGGSKIYYDKEKHRISKKEHRQYKKQLMLDGKIK